MFHQSQEPITREEMERLEKAGGNTFTGRGVSKNARLPTDERTTLDVYQVCVEQCFVPADFNEELPLYLLDIGGMLLILFGQWMFDPHTLTAPKKVFETWDCRAGFFESFSLRSLSASGKVLQLAVRDSCFVKAQRLSLPLKFIQLRESQFVVGHAATLIEDLAKGHLIEPL